MEEHYRKLMEACMETVLLLLCGIEVCVWGGGGEGIADS